MQPSREIRREVDRFAARMQAAEIGQGSLPPAQPYLPHAAVSTTLAEPMMTLCPWHSRFVEKQRRGESPGGGRRGLSPGMCERATRIAGRGARPLVWLHKGD